MLADPGCRGSQAQSQGLHASCSPCTEARKLQSEGALACSLRLVAPKLVIRALLGLPQHRWSELGPSLRIRLKCCCCVLLCSLGRRANSPAGQLLATLKAPRALG